MALVRRCLCWDLRTATFANLVTIVILAGGALLLRLLDIGAFITEFEISQGFKTPWRSHEWQAFLASDVVVIFFHVVIILFTIYMIYMVTQKIDTWLSREMENQTSISSGSLQISKVSLSDLVINQADDHFVLYMETLRTFTYSFIMYNFIEFCFSVFEFSFYGLNTFRLAFVVFIWLYWLARLIAGIIITIVLFSRLDEMENEMAYELRSSDRKYVHSYSALG